MNNNTFIPIDWEKQGGSIIKVIGVGGGGNNAVRNMYNKGIKGVDFIICNTDEQVLIESPVPHKIQLGVNLTRGRGAGCNPEQGKEAAIENLDEIVKVLNDNAEMVFITAGLGGGTGTGAAPVIAKAAKEMGILTVAIATLPFQDEGDESYNRALDGLQQLRQHVDSLLLINNQKLYEIYHDLPVFEAFPKADDIVYTAAKSIAELITVGGYINVDFADVKMVMKDSGMALMGLGSATGEDRALEAAKQALNSPLLSDNNISGAKNILVNISSGVKNPLKMSELGHIMSYINIESGGKANFKRGVTKDESLDEEVMVTIVATGFSMNSFVELEAHLDLDTPETGEIVHLGDPSESTDEIRVKTQSFDLSGNAENAEISIRTVEKSKPIASNSSNSMPIAGNSQLKDSEITQLETIPAYVRRNISIEMKGNSAEEVSRHEIKDADGKHSLDENNSFLERTVD